MPLRRPFLRAIAADFNQKLRPPDDRWNPKYRITYGQGDDQAYEAIAIGYTVDAADRVRVPISFSTHEYSHLSHAESLLRDLGDLSVIRVFVRPRRLVQLCTYPNTRRFG